MFSEEVFELRYHPSHIEMAVFRVLTPYIYSTQGVPANAMTPCLLTDMVISISHLLWL